MWRGYIQRGEGNMKFIVNAAKMTREQEIELEQFLEKGLYDWECYFEREEE